MNPDTNKFEPLHSSLEDQVAGRVRVLQEGQKSVDLFRPNGQPVPKHWSVFSLDEMIVIKGYTFRVKYIGESAILFEPVKPEKSVEK